MPIPVPPHIAIVAQATSKLADRVVTVRPSGDALLIWDASGTIQDVLSRHLDHDAALSVIEQTGASILTQSAQKLPDATTIAIRVIYPHRPEFNAQYQVETVASVERLMTLSASRKNALNDANAWKSAFQRRTTPSGLKIDITGILPPQ